MIPGKQLFERLLLGRKADLAIDQYCLIAAPYGTLSSFAAASAFGQSGRCNVTATSEILLAANRVSGGSLVPDIHAFTQNSRKDFEEEPGAESNHRHADFQSGKGLFKALVINRIPGRPLQ